MKSKYLLYSAGLLVAVALSGCAGNLYQNGCPPTPGGAINGKMISGYQTLSTETISVDKSPAYLTGGAGPDTYATYSSTRTRDIAFPEEVALRGGRRANPGNGSYVYGPGYGHSVARPGSGIRGRRYNGIDPYASNPYAGNTITRGPRDFLMTNPPNIGP